MQNGVRTRNKMWNTEWDAKKNDGWTLNDSRWVWNEKNQFNKLMIIFVIYLPIFLSTIKGTAKVWQPNCSNDSNWIIVTVAQGDYHTACCAWQCWETLLGCVRRAMLSKHQKGHGRHHLGEANEAHSTPPALKQPHTELLDKLLTKRPWNGKESTELKSKELQDAQ